MGKTTLYLKENIRMKNRKTMLCLALVLVLAILLSGCGRKQSNEDTAVPEAPASYDYKTEESAAGAYDSDDSAPMPAPDIAKSAGTTYGDSTSTVGDQIQNSGQKKVYRSYLSIESTDFDNNYNAILAKVDECGGYISNSNMSGGLNYDGTQRLRRANLELKIPTAKYREFLSYGETFGNIVNQNESVEDITSSYLDVEARISSLKAEEERLLELLQQTGTLEELLAVEDRLANVRYEIELYTSTRNTYDSWVNFCTVNIDISEVMRTSPPVVTFGDRIIAAFGDSWSAAADFFRNLAVGLVYALPTLIIFAVIAVVVIIIIKKSKPRRQLKAKLRAEIKADAEAKTAAQQDVK